MTPAPLTTYRDGCALRIHSVCGYAQERLRDVGIREGVCVEMIRNSKELILRIDSCRIGLRRDMAVDVLAVPLSS